jgi:PRC-barrel domain
MATVGPDIMVRETVRLISSDKVEGTPVRRSNGERIGTIERVMIDKRGGRVAYAVMTFGGFLGIGEEYRALPWSVLRYDEDLDAYELNLTDEQLRGAPVSETGFLRNRPGAPRLGASTPRLLSGDALLVSR